MDSTKTLELNGRSVNYVDQGQGEPLLLVHGFPLDHSMWQKQIDVFQSSHRVICPDLPGFGASDPMSELGKAGSAESLSMESLADWLVEFLDAIDCKQPLHYCGLSMGGYIGWQFWRRHASRLKSIIAANTRSAKDDELVRRARHIAAAQVRVSGAGPVADAMVKKLFYLQPEQNPLDIDYIAQVHRMILATDPSSISAGQIGMSQRLDATDWLSEIEIPMLFIGGEFDSITTPAEMQSNAAAATNANFKTITAAGHLTPLEQPEAFNEAVGQFLSKLA